MHVSLVPLNSVSKSGKNEVLLTSRNVRIWVSCIEFAWEVVKFVISRVAQGLQTGRFGAWAVVTAFDSCSKNG